MRVAVMHPSTSRDQRYHIAAQKTWLVIGLTMAVVAVGQLMSFAQADVKKVAAAPKVEPAATRTAIDSSSKVTASDAQTEPQRSALATKIEFAGPTAIVQSRNQRAA